MKPSLFVTGIDTGVGKTVVSAIICEALKADYWKPIQSGDLNASDTILVNRFIENKSFVSYPEAYRLNTPASPHLSAKIDGIRIELNKIIRPQTKNTLVIEGAGGLCVPLNDKDFIYNLIQAQDKVVLVCKNYLGSINHSLLSLKFLQNIGVQKVGVLFTGEENTSTQEAVLSHPLSFPLKRVPWTENLTKNFIKDQSEKLKQHILSFLET